MIKSVFLIGLLMYLFPAYSQAIKVQRLDSARWRMEQVQAQSKAGGATVVYSDIADSATTITKYIQLVEAAKQDLDENMAQKKYDALNAELKKATGKQYEDLLKEAICKNMVGQWNVIKGSDTLSLAVNRDLKVYGGAIRGELKYNNPGDIQIVGVYDKTYSMKILSANQLKGNEIIMSRQ